MFVLSSTAGCEEEPPIPEFVHSEKDNNPRKRSVMEELLEIQKQLELVPEGGTDCMKLLKNEWELQKAFFREKKSYSDMEERIVERPDFLGGGAIYHLEEGEPVAVMAVGTLKEWQAINIPAGCYLYQVSSPFEGHKMMRVRCRE